MGRRARVVVAVLLAAACTGAPRSQPSDAAVAWKADLAALAAGLRATHPNPFWREPEADFDAGLAGAPVPADTTAAALEVMRLVAGIDGHTGVYPSEAGFHLVALYLYLFADGLHVVAASDDALVGGRVTRIGATAPAAALAKVRPYAAHDNDETIDVVAPMLLMTPEILEATGIIRPGERPTYTLETASGGRTVTPDIVDWPGFHQRFGGDPVGFPKRSTPPFLARRDEAFWWDPVEAAGGGTALYLQYNQVVAHSGDASLQAVVDDLRTALEAGANRLVIDLRNNPGGDNHTYAALLRLVRDDPRVNRPGGLYVLIGRQTFSAAMNFATEVDTSTAAVFVGEPTGGRPNLYGDVRPVVLPHSHVRVEVSSRYWPFGGPGDDRPWIAPDIAVALTSDDLLAGRDPVLAAALAA